ncbi:arylsulfatase [Microbulbifer bruguierae]|uniref:Arylsulfatase n=1 Tax=Microbulbifer bruguierae TaxID=3029061 RepID=A0ABY8NFF2_9GAMM|nr:arylsulfatase [Microbulbifer bruguierae]WGL17656.1 arylsulfatase [Microbulbifer bruguierae]
MKKRKRIISTTLAICASSLLLSNSCLADKSVFDETVVERKNFEPAIPRPEQEKLAAKKLADLQSKTGRKPNILIFLVDDMGWGDPGAFGGGVAIGAPTPHINNLASQGLKLTSMYSQPTCTPSRAALTTGRLPVRSGLVRPILTGDKVSKNPWKIEQSSGKMLSAAGYRTALIGKWHVGEAEGMLPHEVGFDYFYGLPSVQSDYTQFLVSRQYSDMINNPALHKMAFTLRPEGLIEGNKGGPRKVAYPINSIDEIRMVDQVLRDQSVKFIKEAAKDSKPFYLIHSFSKLHNDSYVAPQYIGKSPAAMPIRDALVELDDIVGEIMKTLEDTGQLDNTIVFFTSDNGGNEDVWPDTSYHPWRGGKGTTWEGGVRVPGIVYWKGMIEPGQASNELVDLMDLYMTSLRMAGVLDDLPDNLYFDGIDQTAFFLAPNGHSRRQVVYMWNRSDFCALRWRDYKVHFKIFDIKAPRRNIDAALVSDIGTAPWVFNLNVDPKEMSSTGHQFFEWGLPQALRFSMQHQATMKEYPNTDIGLGI